MTNTGIIRNLRVLYVEDDLDLVKVNMKLMESIFSEVHIAYNGLDGFELYSKNKANIDVIITDIEMPKMNGLEMIKKIRDNGDFIPTIILSAYDDKEKLMQALEYGVDSYIKKPFEFSVIVKELEKQIGVLKLRKHYKSTIVEKDTEIDDLQQLRDRLEKEIQLKEEAQAELRKLALYDQLTNIPNRRLFIERITQEVNALKRNEVQIGILYIDLDGFKEVNDTYGHKAGDKVLVEFTKRVLNTIRKSDTFARLGGDEFILMAKHQSEPENSIIVAQKILELTKELIDIDENTKVKVGASIGIAYTKLDCENEITPDNLLARADVAMYEAKKQGKNNYMISKEC